MSRGGHAEVNVHRIGELFIPRTIPERDHWRGAVRDALGAFVTLAETQHVVWPEDEMRDLVDMIGFGEMYRLADYAVGA